MNLSAGRRTWEEAASPAAVRLARKYEQAWRDSDHGRKAAESAALPGRGRPGKRRPGRPAGPACGRTCRCDGKPARRSRAQWYLDRYPSLGEDTIVALVYEEFCLREEDDEQPDAGRVSGAVSRRSARALERVLEIHDLVGSGTPVTVSPNSTAERGDRRGAASSRRRARRSAGSFWSKSWDAGRLPAFFWPGSGSWPIGRWR